MRILPNRVYLVVVLLLALPGIAQAQFSQFYFTTNSDGSLSVSSFYTSFEETVVIPSSTNGLPVTGIEGYAFFNNTNVIGVVIPSSITNIADLAFYESTGLTTISVASNNPVYSSVAGVLFDKNKTTLIAYPEGLAGGYSVPASVTSIGDTAFSGCINLTSITIPSSVTNIQNSVTNIGQGPFTGCPSLFAINVNTNNPAYSSVAGVLFNQNKTALIDYPAGNAGTAYAITNTVADILDYAFDGCSNLTSITIPNSVTNIGLSVFASCSSLTNITIGSSVASIGNFAFSGCVDLTSITIPNSVTNIGASVFLDCTGLVRVTLPDHFPNIGDDAFNSCYQLASITIPNSVTNIGTEAFASCRSLTNIVIGTNVATIRYAFPDCTNLTSVSLPASVSSLAGGAFSGCSSLTAINVAANNSALSSLAGVLFNQNQTTLIDYPEARAGAYYAITNSVTNIGYEAFAACRYLASITIPNSVSNIGAYAFYGCPVLTNACFEGSPPVYSGDPGFDYQDPKLKSICYMAGATGWGPSYAGLLTTSCTECAGVVSGPSIASISLSGINLVLNGINSQSSGTNYILTSTNLALPMAQWTRVATNVFSASGNFTVIITNTVNSNTRQRFYTFQTQ
jgi:hypothetical protein